MTCTELVPNDKFADATDIGRFSALHRDGRNLISDWFQRAWRQRHCRPEDSFEPFIFAWFAFNGWAACVTDEDDDWKWRRSLALSQEVCDSFAGLVADGRFATSTWGSEFHQYWPIFRAQALRRRGFYGRMTPTNRQEMIEQYLAEGIRSFEPKCWLRHREEGSGVPLDWPHTLYALNRVRNNLFHGEKAAHSEMDRQIVLSAFQVLLHFLAEARYIDSARRRL